MNYVEIGQSFGFITPLKADSTSGTHGYSSRSLANDTTKAYAQVWVRCKVATDSYAVGDPMTDADGTDLDGVFMTAPAPTDTKRLVWSCYAGPGDDTVGEWEVELSGYFFDPDDATKKIHFKRIESITVTNNSVA